MITQTLWRDSLSSIVMLVIVGASLLLSQVAHAKTTILWEDDLTITFLSGQFDPKNYEGEIFDVTIRNDDDILATAERILIIAEGTWGEPDYFIQRFEVDNLDTTLEQIRLTAQSIQIDNLYLGWLADEASAQPAKTFEWTPTTFKMTQIKLTDEATGYALSMPHMETMPVDFIQLSDGRQFLGSAGFEIPSIQIRPYGQGEDAEIFQERLDVAQLPYLELSIRAHQQNIVQDTEILSDTMVQVRLPHLLEFFVRTEFYTSKEAFNHWSDPQNWDDVSDDYASDFIAETKLGSFALDLRDLGFRELVQQTGDVLPYPLLAEQLQEIITSFLPETGDDLARPIGQFLTDGGALRLTAKPDIPFRTENLAAALFMPDYIVNQINLRAVHTP